MAVLKLAGSDEFALLIRQMQRAMDSAVGRGSFGFSPTDAFRPSVNLYETPDSFLICVDLAGMDQKDIDVQVERGHVVIRGRRISPLPPDGARPRAVHLMEIDHGSFCRTVEIPASVEDQQIAATYTRGMLWVTLPKRMSSGARAAVTAMDDATGN